MFFYILFMSTLKQLSQVPMVPYEINQILHHNISDLTILKSRQTIYRNYPINISSQVGSLLITCNANMLSAKSLQLCRTQCDPLDCSLLSSSVHGDSPGENTGENCHALLQGNIPNPGTELMSLTSPALAGEFFMTSTTWKAQSHDMTLEKFPNIL